MSVTAEILLTLSLCGGGGWWVVMDQSHFHVKPNFWVELRFSWGCDNNCQDWRNYVKTCLSSDICIHYASVFPHIRHATWQFVTAMTREGFISGYLLIWRTKSCLFVCFVWFILLSSAQTQTVSWLGSPMEAEIKLHDRFSAQRCTRQGLRQ